MRRGYTTRSSSAASSSRPTRRTSLALSCDLSSAVCRSASESLMCGASGSSSLVAARRTLQVGSLVALGMVAFASACASRACERHGHRVAACCHSCTRDEMERTRPSGSSHSPSRLSMALRTGAEARRSPTAFGTPPQSSLGTSVSHPSLPIRSRAPIVARASGLSAAAAPMAHESSFSRTSRWPRWLMDRGVPLSAARREIRSLRPLCAQLQLSGKHSVHTALDEMAESSATALPTCASPSPSEYSCTVSTTAATACDGVWPKSVELTAWPLVAWGSSAMM